MATINTIKFKIKKFLETEVEVKNPSYYHQYGTYTRITDKGIYQVSNNMIVFTENKSFFYEEDLKRAMEGQEITDMEFLDAWDKSISLMSERLVL